MSYIFTTQLNTKTDKFSYTSLSQTLHIGETYSRIKCQIYTHSKENLRNYFITFICCYLLSFILIEVCTLQIKSLRLLF